MLPQASAVAPSALGGCQRALLPRLETERNYVRFGLGYFRNGKRMFPTERRTCFFIIAKHIHQEITDTFLNTNVGLLSFSDTAKRVSIAIRSPKLLDGYLVEIDSL